MSAGCKLRRKPSLNTSFMALNLKRTREDYEGSIPAPGPCCKVLKGDSSPASLGSPAVSSALQTTPMLPLLRLSKAPTVTVRSGLQAYELLMEVPRPQGFSDIDSDIATQVTCYNIGMHNPAGYPKQWSPVTVCELCVHSVAVLFLQHPSGGGGEP